MFQQFLYAKPFWLSRTFPAVAHPSMPGHTCRGAQIPDAHKDIPQSLDFLFRSQLFQFVEDVQIVADGVWQFASFTQVHLGPGQVAQAFDHDKSVFPLFFFAPAVQPVLRRFGIVEDVYMLPEPVKLTVRKVGLPILRRTFSLAKRTDSRNSDTDSMPSIARSMLSQRTMLVSINSRSSSHKGRLRRNSSPAAPFRYNPGPAGCRHRRYMAFHKGFHAYGCVPRPSNPCRIPLNLPRYMAHTSIPGCRPEYGAYR